MKRSEVEKITGLTRKAILYYEDKGLIRPHKGENNYRAYTQDDVKKLLKISIYRKLGLSISEIKNILDSKEEDLGSILRDRQYRLELEEAKKNSLERLIKSQDFEEVSKELEDLEKKETIYERLTRVFPGYFGQIFFISYKPFLGDKLGEDQEPAFYELIKILDSLPEFNFTEEEKAYIERITRDFDLEDLEAVNQGKIQAVYNYEDWMEDNRDKVKAYEDFKESEDYKSSQVKKIYDKIRTYMVENNYYDLVIPLIRKISPSYDEYYKKLLEANEKFLSERNK
ncbi:MerR family transcriptional regulator [Peptoniphilus harei]|uniref:MerR family transcriptional regulator n=1 Tax=Peptoniphilus harei TaxID=54005 RepID=UPI00290B02CE|nr:MerR family transcriptional regulator [Peptoniphilus harei]MDU6098106.1 MerR family transcriptional regulator [Peptoniphilus harei]